MTGVKGRSGGARSGAGRPRQQIRMVDRPAEILRISRDHALMLDTLTRRWNERQPDHMLTPQRLLELLITQEAARDVIEHSA